jgi:hypothetical protein
MTEHDTNLKTQASLECFESEFSKYTFNIEDEKISESFLKKSSIFSNFVKNNVTDIFNFAINDIHTETYTPLCNLFEAHLCNKHIDHNYPRFYYYLLHKFKDFKLNMVEVGIGTPNQDVQSSMPKNYKFGSSQKGWRDFFSNEETKIFGCDIDSRVRYSDERISTFYLNSLNPNSVKKMLLDSNLELEQIDIFLDDGLHMYKSQLALLLVIWPYIKLNGIYMIEDIIEGDFKALVNMIKKLELGASCAAVELPHKKGDNRIIVLQKNNYVSANTDSINP